MHKRKFNGKIFGFVDLHFIFVDLTNSWKYLCICSHFHFLFFHFLFLSLTFSLSLITIRKLGTRKDGGHSLSKLCKLNNFMQIIFSFFKQKFFRFFFCTKCATRCGSGSLTVVSLDESREGYSWKKKTKNEIKCKRYYYMTQ